MFKNNFYVRQFVQWFQIFFYTFFPTSIFDLHSLGYQPSDTVECSRTDVEIHKRYIYIFTHIPQPRLCLSNSFHDEMHHSGRVAIYRLSTEWLNWNTSFHSVHTLLLFWMINFYKVVLLFLISICCCEGLHRFSVHNAFWTWAHI